MNQQQINKYFDKYWLLNRKIKTCESELMTLKEITSAGISGHSFDGIGSTLSSGLDNKLSKIESLENKLSKLYLKKEKMKQRYIKDFNKLSLIDYEIILTLFYLDEMPLKYIASRLDKSLGYVKKLKQDAINELFLNIAK